MIEFFFHQVDIPGYFDESKIQNWLKALSNEYQKPINSIHYILSTDEYVLSLNQQFLDHDYYTDILTFPQSYDPLEAEIYISLERVEENARTHEGDKLSELLRVIAHGFLHMAGYNDSNAKEEQAMRTEEEKCIARYF